ncbi:sunset domain-containing protein [Candidatus Mycolicibacterium alkanivorans]|uniref:LGFP repeat-containing protein n=1 Tax=Candidatus Mycolicibacterium alkanivorans TaxID=2954114 RepID=A0ABS9YZZ8_9MYCO|nr:hypothetical protein [Candidatus Mycolicibacterium alkanivorans]MCI4676293.1 hypothetical protein [Candidatus Mycolicibacterium alkanivorans]
MTWLGSRLSRGTGRIALGVFATAAAAVLVAPAAVATPESDAANDAINQAWQAAGGDGSPVGGRDGDVYQVGDGFAQNFSSGKIFFTAGTGAHLIDGAILDKYQALGGPADSDLGFPTIDEVTGLLGPSSRVSTFSASDKPAIFWTPDTGAWVVRGAINAAWDELGGSGGTLGAPTGDETYDGDVVSQKFSGGTVSYNNATKVFTTDPPDLAANLAGVEVPSDATTAINQAWRAAGGLAGPLGARQGAQYTVGDNGAAQDYSGGKIFYSPATGAHAATGAILSKYDSLGGPKSDLGLPIGTEADGGAANSRVSAFSAPDKPVIFWTPDTGAIVVRGAINAAWGKLGGATGKLGVPTGEQKTDGDTVTQTFSGGEISFNTAANTFSTKPAELAGQLSGIEVPAGTPGPSAPGKSGKGLNWHWWWLLVIIPALLLVSVIALGLMRLQRRRAAHLDDEDYDDDDHWADGGRVQVPQSSGYGRSAPDATTKTMPGPEDVLDGDQDSIDTTPTRIPSEPEPETAPELVEVPAEFVEHEEYAEVEEVDEEPSDTGRHAAVNLEESQSMWRLNMGELGTPRRRRAAEDVTVEPEDYARPAEVVESGDEEQHGAAKPAIHLPLADPYQAPEGYVIKANTHSGLYYTPDCALYDHTVPEVWFASEELAQANGFIKAE